MKKYKNYIVTLVLALSLIFILLLNHKQLVSYQLKKESSLNLKSTVISTCYIAAEKGISLEETLSSLKDFYYSSNSSIIRLIPYSSFQFLCKQSYSCGEREDKNCISSLFSLVQSDS